jgi:hypothetical protein
VCGIQIARCENLFGNLNPSNTKSINKKLNMLLPLFEGFSLSPSTSPEETQGEGVEMLNNFLNYCHYFLTFFNNLLSGHHYSTFI